MKQTNNAIKFLMAQYRAIFQNAYFKGLATAAVLTAGLAAGQAQAKNITDTEFAAFTENQEITSDVIAIAKDASNTNAITLTIKEGATHAITSGSTTFSNGTIVLAGTGAADATKLTISGATGGATTLSLKDLQLKNGTLALANNAANGGKVEADTITIGALPVTDTPETVAVDTPAEPTAVVTVSSGSTLGKAATAYQLYDGAQITVEEGGTLTGASLKAAGGKIIYNDNADFTLKSYNEKDTAKSAQVLDLDVAAGKTLSVKLAGAAKDNRGVLHFGNGSKIDLKAGATSGGILAITSGTGNSGSVVIFDKGVTLTSTGSDTKGGFVTVAGQNSDSISELKTDADVLGNFLIENDGDKAGGVLVDANSKITINNKKVVLGATSTTNTKDALNLLVKSGDAAAVGQLTVKAETTLSADNLSIIGQLDDGTKLASKLDIVADELTLGAADFDSNANKFGFKSATAGSALTFVSKADGKTLKLQEAVTLNNVDDSGAALNGTISGDVELGTTLTIKGGNYTYNDNITIGSTADNKLEIKPGDGVDKASLVLGGSLLVDRTSGGSVTASGTDSGEAFLDLSNATIAFTGDKTDNAITFTADKNATIKVGGESLQELVKDPNTKGAIFSVANGGTLLVGGDLTLADASTQLKNSGVANSGIQLASGTVAVDGTLTLQQADTVSLGVNAGVAKLQAQTLSLQDATPDTATEEL